MKTKNCIIIHFPAYAGGKFIGNCLSLSKYCMIPNRDSIDHLLEIPDDYDYRLQQVLNILPDHTQNMKDWVSDFEFDEIIMYGRVFSEWQDGRKGQIDKEILNLTESDSMFFITAHSLSTVVNLLKVWNDATVISLVNYRKFQHVSYEKKGTRGIENANECIEKYSMLKGNSWPVWKEFQQVGYNVKKLTGSYPIHILNEIEEYYPSVSDTVFDMDSCIFDKNRFVKSMKQLYKDLGFDDFNKKLITSYWDRYIALHV